MELFDRIVTVGTILLILWLFVRNPGEFIREWIVRPFWGAETADRMAARTASAQPAQPAQPAHDTRTASAHDEDARIDCAARALAARLSGEAAIIELMFDGVTRGGGARYVALRDAVRERARAYGARVSDTPRTITISGKREIEL